MLCSSKPLLGATFSLFSSKSSSVSDIDGCLTNPKFGSDLALSTFPAIISKN